MRLPDATGRAPRPLSPHRSHHEVSRRVFLRGSAGAAGLLLGSGLLQQLPALAAPPGTGQPKPIPGGITVGGTTFHVFLPGPGAEPSLITDLNGFSGVAVLDGTWAATGTPTGGVSSGVWEADMRFMKGLFVGTDGLRRQGAFAFIWVDLFPVSVGTDQLHDFNPGITASGLFWTVAMPSGSVTVKGLSGSASMRGQALEVQDYFTIANALFGGIPPVPATLSFAVEWAGATGGGSVDDAANDFALQFVTTGATMEWTVDSAGATYTSTGVTGVPFAIIGKERNGIFH